MSPVIHLREFEPYTLVKLEEPGRRIVETRPWFCPLPGEDFSPTMALMMDLRLVIHFPDIS